MFLNSKLIFVAIKNGMHQDEGYAYFSDGIKNFAPSDGDHERNSRKYIKIFESLIMKT